MKTKILFLLAVLGMCGKTSAAITANLTINAVVKNEITNKYEITFFTGSKTSTTCSGKFKFAFQRTVTPNIESSWMACTALLITQPCESPTNVCSGFYKVIQEDDTKYYYRVKIIFDPQSNIAGDSCATKPNEYETSDEKMIDLTMKACFTISNPGVEETAGSIYGNQIVKNICASTGNIIINGSCSVNETGYHLKISRFNIGTWTVLDNLFEGWVSASGQAPSAINLNNIIATNGQTFQTDTVYLVNLSVGTIWHSTAPQFFKINGGCKNGDFDQTTEVLQDLNTPMVIYPNPTADKLTLNFNSTKVQSVAVFDLYGKKIDSFVPQKDTKTMDINMSSYQTGTYLVHLETEDGIIIKKILKN